MTDYQQFDTPDFMQDPFFCDWAAGRSAEATAFWEAWLLAHPEKKEAVLQAKAWLPILWNANAFDELPEPEQTERIRRIEQARLRRYANPVRHRLGGWKVLLMAASVMLLLGAGWLTYATYATMEPGAVANRPRRISYQQAVAAVANRKPIEYGNPSGQRRRVRLSDGSVVTLSAHSRISFVAASARQGRRTAYLSGEAFFEIARDPARPFLVYANGIVTKVLGTSFAVRAYENTANVRVQVRSGRVAVFASPKTGNTATIFHKLTNGLVLTPNQQVMLTPGQSLVKSIVSKPVLLRPKDVVIGAVYTDVPLSRIFQKLEESYGIEIDYDEAVFRDCLLTARLYDEPLMDQIALFCRTVGATYTLAEGRIVVDGKGCK